MHIIELLKKEHIIGDLSAHSKEEVLGELAGILVQNQPGVDKKLVVRTMEDREKLGTTGIGDGVAIPHGKIDGISSTMISFGRSENGVPFDAMDGKPVHIFFMLAAPESSIGKHLKALAKISRMLKDEKFRAKLVNASSVNELYDIIKNKDEEEF